MKNPTVKMLVNTALGILATGAGVFVGLWVYNKYVTPTSTTAAKVAETPGMVK